MSSTNDLTNLKEQSMPNYNFHNIWIKLTNSQKNQLNKLNPNPNPKPYHNHHPQMFKYYRCKNRIIILPFGLK